MQPEPIQVAVLGPLAQYNVQFWPFSQSRVQLEPVSQYRLQFPPGQARVQNAPSVHVVEQPELHENVQLLFVLQAIWQLELHEPTQVCALLHSQPPEQSNGPPVLEELLEPVELPPDELLELVVVPPDELVAPDELVTLPLEELSALEPLVPPMPPLPPTPPAPPGSPLELVASVDCVGGV